MPHERLEWIIKYYNDLEKKRMEAWGMIQEIRELVEENGLTDIVDITPMINSEARFKNGVLKITVFDYLPRKCAIEKNVKKITNYWLKSIKDAIDRCEEVPKFKKAKCFICSHVPHNRIVDPDNLAYKLIIDALRYNGIVKNDSINEISFDIEGRIDKDNPRTEIYVFEYRDLLEEMGMR